MKKKHIPTRRIQKEPGPPKPVPGEDCIEQKIDRDLAASFPASDPPGWTLGLETNRNEKGKDKKSKQFTKSSTGGLMKALRFVGVGRRPEIQDMPKPQAGPGQIVIKIGGAGVCHSDLHVMEEDLGFEPPFTLGHENAGWIAEMGAGVKGFKEGDAVAVYGPWGCGHCHSCQLSMENYCENWASLKEFGGGLGFDGGMAEYMVIPSPRLLVPLGNLNPAEAAPLTDAALTPYHAIKRALPFLNPEDAVVVLGVGGLGHMAVQMLRVLSPVRIIAGDVDEEKLQQAKKLGADDVVSTRNVDQAAEQIKKITGRRGAGLVLDCVGVQPTVDVGAKLLGRNSVWTIVGLGGGHHDFHHGSTPYGSTVCIPYWGSRVELIEVIAMAQDHRIHSETTPFPLEEAVEVYDKLKSGKIQGRAVLVPGSSWTSSQERRTPEMAHRT